MDGEADPLDTVGVDAHLLFCAWCQAWHRDALRLNRSIRVRPAFPTPDLTAAILAAVADPGDRPATTVASSAGRSRRWLLGLVAFVQVMLGMSELLGVSRMGMTMSRDNEHLFNESTAWNLALGIGLAVAALWPRLAGGLLPTLGVFLSVLLGVSVIDLVDGNVDLTRVGSHVVIVLGMALLALVHRDFARDPGPGRHAGQHTTAGVAAETMPDFRTTGSARQRRGLRPAGRHAA